ncbi:MAG: ATP-binding protein [Lachnospiraceae bacterium]|nr:ATP-binding protein [Lachnospiraceae bacterium]
MRSNELILYKNFKRGEILEDAAYILSGDTVDDEGVKNRMNSFTGALVELAVSHGYSGNLWQAYLTYLIANNENAYSTSCEIRGKAQGTINAVALHDFSIFREMFTQDLEELDKLCGTDQAGLISNYIPSDDRSRTFNKRIRDRIIMLRDQLAASSSDEDFADKVTQFYKEFGVGKFGLHKAFRVRNDGNGVEIVPITNIKHVYLEDLVGYEAAKKKLTDNTEAFLEGRPCNNCLLFGDAGTGKSSSIKGILNRYFEKGLRIIEVYKHQFRDLNDIIAQIKDRNYRFIIFMDDLSFEEFETDYKYLKALIEGGLEKKPDNILIYATSNRRHIVREKFSDKAERDDELHTNDTVQEKLSLAYRFGETIFFGRPDKKQFDEIVRTLADRYGITVDEEELLLEANKWELSHGGLSGRCAQQFIDHMLSIGGKV